MTLPAVVPAHHRDGRPVPRWAVVAAHLVPLTTLPSALWRIPLSFGFPMGVVGVHLQWWEPYYFVALSLVTEGVALLTLGLVQPWGERVPGWVPLLGGRRVPPLAAVVPAALGAVALQLIWAFAFRDFPHLGDFHFAHEGWRLLMVACYAPLLLWAPLLAAVTVAYYRRRCRG
ncbi:hypothetical protein [Pseudonocardia sp. MH-G8]|uniref:hypothetical protein n=1 Tax=Pseudonocardia sp. MH-G8 TaxID=1854588 RepID=UPI000B9FC0D8|nr:hypothetical protein [Pseudonocardia sp. MH-G8]OZM82208.1 hypothetical protein CFP66_10485 [Pseudonocardia sp. MH-G8]